MDIPAELNLSTKNLSRESVRLKVAEFTGVIQISGLALEFGSKENMRLFAGLSLSTLQVRYSSGIFFINKLGEKSEILHKGSLYFSSENLSLNQKRLIGALKLVPSVGNKFLAVVELPVDEYLVGVLPAEMPVSWPMEALKAQAVASRSYALAVKEARKTEAFDLESTVADQVFNLKHFDRLPTRLQDKVREAIEATSGQVIKLNPDKILKTYFHAHCGGHTRSSQEVWGVNGQDITVADQNCSMDQRGDWRYSLSEDLLLKTFFKDEVQGSLSLFSEKGRAIVLRVGASTKKVSGDMFRKLLGYDKVKTTSFSVKETDHGVELHGRGNGHGVGMCQSGARFMAKTGHTYEQILNRYYGHKPTPESKLLAKKSAQSTTL